LKKQKLTEVRSNVKFNPLVNTAIDHAFSTQCSLYVTR